MGFDALSVKKEKQSGSTRKLKKSKKVLIESIEYIRYAGIAMRDM